MQCALCHHFDAFPQQGLKVHNKPAGKPRTRYRANVDQKVNVAVGLGVTSRHRAEDPHLSRAMFGGHLEDLLTLQRDQLTYVEDLVHSLLSYISRRTRLARLRDNKRDGTGDNSGP